MPKPEHERLPLRHQDEERFRDNFDGDPNTPPPQTASSYRIANYVDGLVGVFAGPTTAWGDVRETLRRYDFAGLVEAVPRAIDETFNGAMVRLDGSDEEYPAIYIEPRNGTLRLLGFTADDAAQLFEHGFAWLNGDFRDGPHDPLGELREVTIVSAGKDIGLLVDGERGHSHAPLRLRAVLSPVNFIVTRPQATEAHTG